jgi:hypothetical protein
VSKQFACAVLSCGAFTGKDNPTRPDGDELRAMDVPQARACAVAAVNKAVCFRRSIEFAAAE